MLLAEENRDFLSIGTKMAGKTRAAINLFAFQSAFCEPVFKADYGKVMTVKKVKRISEKLTSKFFMCAECYQRCGLNLASVTEVCLKCTID